MTILKLLMMKLNYKKRLLKRRLVFSQKSTEKCQVCAKGALFAVKALNYNNCKVDKNIIDFDVDEYDVIEALDGIFSEHQLDLIENAFEVEMIQDDTDTKKEYGELLRAAYMYRRSETGNKLDAETRLHLIMENIVKHRGTFKLPRFKDFTPESQLDIKENIEGFDN